MNFQAPEGTYDVVPHVFEAKNADDNRRQTACWNRLESAARACFARFGYEEIRPAILEYTALFHKSSGEATDIVEKEMFTFGDPEDKKGTYSLRPELTPGTIRALIEQGLFAKKNFWKVWYLGPAFRKERPQKGRYRQFTQIGVEAVGSPDPLVDAETMILFSEILKAVGVSAWELRINSIGCGDCRDGYRQVLKEAIRPLLPTLDENCNRRFERNVFRILDCKVDAPKTGNLPRAIDHTCQKCKDHMAVVEQSLQANGVPYRVDPRIVRGLDYYTRTVYEFSSSKLGSQDALAGGGRYDTLVGSMGGPNVGSVGFAAGVERILLAMEGDAASPAPDFYAVAAGDVPRSEIFKTVVALRRAGLSGDMDFESRSLKAQMRSANKTGARYALLIGPEEAQKGAVKLKDMKDGTELTVTVDEAVRKLQGGKS